MSAVLVKAYGAPAIDRREILRYAGAGAASPELDRLLDECLGEVERELHYRVCYGVFPVSLRADALDLGFTEVRSRDLKKNLEGCESIVLFAATVGLAPDRLIARYSRTAPARALIHQAIGAERVESLCDSFCREIGAEFAAKGLSARPRFSPGYGDLPLDMQREIFRALDCPKRIGLTLSSSLLMSPTKSVTAIIGIRGNT